MTQQIPLPKRRGRKYEKEPNTILELENYNN